jgi:hypothetical protein
MILHADARAIPLADESVHALELLRDEEPRWSPELVPEVWR